MVRMAFAALDGLDAERVMAASSGGVPKRMRGREDEGGGGGGGVTVGAFTVRVNEVVLVIPPPVAVTLIV